MGKVAKIEVVARVGAPGVLGELVDEHRAVRFANADPTAEGKAGQCACGIGTVTVDEVKARCKRTLVPPSNTQGRYLARSGNSPVCLVGRELAEAIRCIRRGDAGAPD
jgi:hypothetical protein